MLQDRPASSMPGGVVRCSKARAMFASRACRKSVMVGHKMTMGQMTAVSTFHATTPIRRSLALVGCAPHGDHGPTVELPAWTPDHAPSRGSPRYCPRRPRRLA